jgi:hypothetical protein
LKSILKWLLVLALALAACARAADGGAPRRYSGTAVDDKGQPVAGATVECYVDSSPVASYTAQDFALKESGTTDSKGAFTVPIGGGVTIVVVKKEGLAPGWRTFASVLGESSDPVVLTALASPARSEVDRDGQLISYSAPVSYALAGRVVDENGRPVADAEVWVSLAMPVPKSGAPLPAIVPGVDSIEAILNLGPGGGELSQKSMIFGKPARDCFSTRTGADGRFRIANFPGNTQAALAVHKSGMAFDRDNFGRGIGGFNVGISSLARITAPPPYISGLQWNNLPGVSWQHELMPYTSGQLGIELPLEPGKDIEGRVIVQATGQPLPGVKLLEIFSGRGLAGLEMPEPVFSGADGTFRMTDASPERVGIAAVFPGDPVADWVAQSVSYVFVSPAAEVQIRAVEGEMAAIAVMQRNSRQPLANATVSATGGNSPATAVTGPDGVAWMRLLPGHWIVSVSKEGWNDGQASLMVEAGQPNREAALLDWRYRLTGTVRDPFGEPVAGAIVSLNLGGNNYQVKTGPTGGYEAAWQVFTGGSLRSFSLLARSAERHLAVTHDIDVSVTNLDLKLEPAVTLLAKVEDPAGKPVSGAAVSLTWKHVIQSGSRLEALGAGTSDDQGRVEFPDIPPEDNYSISVTANGYGLKTADVLSYPRQANRLEFPTIVLLRANLKLAGHLLGADGKPVAGADIRMGVSGGNYSISKTDETGRFDFDTASEGPLYVAASSPGDDGPYKNLNYINITAQGGDTNIALQYVANGQEAGARQVTTSGTVLDPVGTPVAGAPIWVLPVNGTKIGVRSDADGKYAIVWVKHNVWGNGAIPFIYACDPERHLAAGQDIDETTTNQDVRLEAGLTLSVKAEDATGKPIPSAMEFLYSYSGQLSFLMSPTQVKANDQGVIEINDLPQGRHYMASITGPGYGTVKLEAQAEQTKTNRFEFPPAVFNRADRKVAGRVLSPEGKPLSGVIVYLSGAGQPNSRATTDDTGHFIFDSVNEGAVQLLVSSGEPGADIASRDVHTIAGASNLVIRLARPAAGGTSGTVFDSSGNPAASVRVKIWGSAGNADEVKTDSDGRYSISWQKKQGLGIAWTPFVFARDLEHNLAASQNIDDTVSNQDLTLQPGLTLSVKVQDVNGKPIPTATAVLSLWSGLQEFKFSQTPCKADDRGIIEIPTLPQERHYTAVISATGCRPVTLKVRAAETQTNRFEFPVVLKMADRKLAGQVLDPDGKPVPRIQVSLQGEGQPNLSARTDAGGRFAFAGVCEGPVQLRANSTNYFGMTGDVQAQGGDTNVVIRFKLNGPLVATSGAVLDPSGAPVSGARLSVFMVYGREAVSDADGKYSLLWRPQNRAAATNPAPALPYLLVGRDPERALAAAVEIDDQTTNVDLHLQTPLTLSGSVRETGGAPVTNVDVLLYIGRRGLAYIPQQRTPVDAQGAFSISNLPPGQQYSVAVRAPGYGNASQRVAAADTQTASLRLPPIILTAADKQLEGHVVDAKDRPVQGAQVNLSGNGQPNGICLTDFRGRFLFNQVCEGPVSLFAYYNMDGSVGSDVPKANVQAQGGDTNVLVKLLPPNAAPLQHEP